MIREGLEAEEFEGWRVIAARLDGWPGWGRGGGEGSFEIVPLSWAEEVWKIRRREPE